MTLRIGILGAGPAGLLSALALERYAPPGLDITLLERSRSETDYPGVEYGIQERACRALERIGQRDAALRRGHPVSRIAFYELERRRERFAVDIDPRYAVGVLRQEFLADLVSLLRRAVLLREHRACRLERLPDERVRVHFDAVSGAAPAPREFDCLIASDGVGSIARQELFPERALHDRGFSILYLLIDAAAVDPAELPPRFTELANGPRIEFARGRLSTNSYYPQGRNRLTLAFGFPDETQARLWQEEGLAERAPWPSIPPEKKRALALRLAADTPVHGDVFRSALSLVSDWDSHKIYFWRMRDSDPLPRPYATLGNVVLIGDAAHAFLPTIGMGASLAMEDAERLAARLGAFVVRVPDEGAARRRMREEVFVPFARERYPVWEDLMRRARTAARNFVGQSARRGFLLSPYVRPAILSRLLAAAEWVGDRLRR